MISKITKFLAVFTVLGLIFVSSCQNVPYLDARVQDHEFKALYILSAYGKYDSVHNGFIILAGERANLDSNAYLVLLIKGNKPGQYNLDLTLDSNNIITQCEAFYLPTGNRDSSSNFYVANKGYINLVSVDASSNTIKGKFEFTLKNKDNQTIEIKNGQFGNVLYINTDYLTSIFNYNR